MNVNDLYERLLERDAAIPEAVRAFREEHSPDELFLAVARFALLAYAPSQHAKHALLCCLTAHDLRDELGGRFDEAVTQCAIYTAKSRLPWSEAPILDPPRLAEGQRGDRAELLAAIEAGDRLRAERWLAKRQHDDDLLHDYFSAAANDFSDLGHKLIIATGAWRLANLLGEHGRYAAMRVGIWECAAYRGEPYVERGTALDCGTLAASLIDAAVAERGSLESMHAIFLLDAALDCGDPAVLLRVRDYLTAERRRFEAAGEEMPPAAPLAIYEFSRDLGTAFKAHAVAARFRRRFPALDVDRMIAAADWNRQHGASLEDFDFA